MTTRELLEFPFAPGTVIDGRLVVKEGVEVGGMGHVFCVWDREGERDCCLKTILPGLHPRFCPALDLCELMRRERVTAATLAVDNDFVPRIFQGGTIWVSAEVQGKWHELDLPYYSMERLQGTTFERIIRLQRQQRELLPWRTVVDLSLLCARAVQAVHRRGFIHRDIKPSNIFLHQREDGSRLVKLIDCGISARAGDKLLLGTGTARFGSPESFVPGNAANEAGDNYALALVVYELALWRGPFVAADLRGYACAHQFIAPAGIRQTPTAESAASRFRPDAPPELEDILLRALSKSPADRPSTDAILDALEGIRERLTREGVPPNAHHDRPPGHLALQPGETAIPHAWRRVSASLPAAP
ncbi:serine/threonine-protein kinase [Pendulispora albinea]|uniref:non-specific serine/threonine protein kinase n=1 Tax=Pendulispora albinea TaxID=2741071 RepID=A0ABZ2LL78_9BACT